MNHIDPHTLELFVLGNEGVQDQRSAIEAHLADCAGCRALEEEMRMSYAESVQHYTERKDRTDDHETALVKRRRESSLSANTQSYLDKSPIYPSRRSPLQRVTIAIRHNPIKSAAASFAILGVLVVMFNLTADRFFRTKNPAFVHYNFTQNKIEVYDTRNELLWSLIPTVVLESTKQNEEIVRLRYTQVVDLDGDGTNEVITSLPIAGSAEPEQALRIYNADMSLRKTILPPERILDFKSNHYETGFMVGAFVVGRFKADGKTEIVVALSNGRSPGIVARYDVDGRLLGEYYHYGNFISIYPFDVHHDGRTEIIALAQSDLYEDERKWLPIIAVLDVEKISGRTESRMTRGFGLPASDAEAFYIQIPENDITRALGTKMALQGLEMRDTSKQLRFYAIGQDREDQLPAFEFIFSRNLTNLDVKYTNTTATLHAALAREGKVTGSIDNAYLKNLNDHVIYHIPDGRRIPIAGK